MSPFYPNPALGNNRRKAREAFSEAKEGSFSKEQPSESFAPCQSIWELANYAAELCE